jgi:hypothetical protein
VGGSIILHGIPALHHSAAVAALPGVLADAAVGLVAGAAALLVVEGFRRLRR